MKITYCLMKAEIAYKLDIRQGVVTPEMLQEASGVKVSSGPAFIS